MKVLRILMFAIYFFVYGYSTYKTSVEPDRLVWGYICTLVFGILCIWAVNLFANSSNNKKKENDEQT